MGSKIRRWLRVLGPRRTHVRRVDGVETLELDARGIPTAACPTCGEGWFTVPVVFDEETYEVAAWALEGMCISCGTVLTVCCPADKDVERFM